MAIPAIAMICLISLSTNGVYKGEICRVGSNVEAGPVVIVYAVLEFTHGNVGIVVQQCDSETSGI